MSCQLPSRLKCCCPVQGAWLSGPQESVSQRTDSGQGLVLIAAWPHNHHHQHYHCRSLWLRGRHLCAFFGDRERTVNPKRKLREMAPEQEDNGCEPLLLHRLLVPAIESLRSKPTKATLVPTTNEDFLLLFDKNWTLVPVPPVHAAFLSSTHFALHSKAHSPWLSS